VEELETKVKKAIEEMTRLEQQLSGVDREKKHLADEAAKLEQQLSQTSKEKQKVLGWFMLPFSAFTPLIGCENHHLRFDSQVNICLRPLWQ